MYDKLHIGILFRWPTLYCKDSFELGYPRIY